MSIFRVAGLALILFPSMGTPSEALQVALACDVTIVAAEKQEQAQVRIIIDEDVWAMSIARERLEVVPGRVEVQPLYILLYFSSRPHNDEDPIITIDRQTLAIRYANKGQKESFSGKCATGAFERLRKI